MGALKGGAAPKTGGVRRRCEKGIACELFFLEPASGVPQAVFWSIRRGGKPKPHEGVIHGRLGRLNHVGGVARGHDACAHRETPNSTNRRSK